MTAQILDLHHVSISVVNLLESWQFYLMAGFEPIISDFCETDRKRFRIGSYELHLIALPEGVDFRPGDFRFSIQVSDVEDFLRRFTLAGGQLVQKAQPKEDQLGVTQALVRDPSGNLIEVVYHDVNLMHQALIDDLKRKGRISLPPVEVALRTVPRHLFLSRHSLETAYSDISVIVKDDVHSTSSCSQPSIIARMLQQLNLSEGERVLEIGTGTGYNAALMSSLVGTTGRVVSIEVDKGMANEARHNLSCLSENVDTSTIEVVCSDGGWGYDSGAPYDAIISTAGIWDISPYWTDQMKPMARLVVPLSFNTLQFSILFEKLADNCLISRDLCGCGFMRLRGTFSGPEKYVCRPEFSYLIDDPTQVDAASLESLLATTPNKMNIPALSHGQGLKFIEYLALTGESLITFYGHGETARFHQAYGLVDSIDSIQMSLTLLHCSGESVGVTNDVFPTVSIYGAMSTLSRLQDAAVRWEKMGCPGAEAAVITAKRSQEGVVVEPDFLLKKRWMDYQVDFART